MVYIKYLLDGKATLLLLCLAFGIIVAEVESTKIAYKKPINGKAQTLKLKPLRPKAEENEYHTTTTTLSPLSEMVLRPPMIHPNPSIFELLEFAESSHAVKTVKKSEKNKKIAPKSEDNTKPMEQFETTEATLDTTDANVEDQSTVPTISNPKEINEAEEAVETIAELPDNDIEAEPIIVDEPIADLNDTQATSSEHPTNKTTESTDADTTTLSKRPTPCTCGIFMTSQIKRSKNPYEPPTGEPVITNELDRAFACNAVGQKQCQTKCLEAIVQHLPNSANILCATLDRDIRKERAYLYIKNCRNQWFNTNLAAGREYCCKNSQPYQCPLV